MKNTIYLFIGLLLIHFCDFSYCNNVNTEKGVTENNISSDGLITIQCSPDLYDLTSKWAGEYEKLNPGVGIKVVQNTEISKSSILNEKGNLFFFSDESSASFNNEGVWKMVVGRDAIVPIINSKNPLLKEINEQGISSDDLARLFKNPADLQWGTILDKANEAPLHYYKTVDASVNSRVEAFLNQEQIPEVGTIVSDGKEMIASIQKDPNGFGFCRMKDLFDLNGQNIPDNIS
jgi:phosphate transport system substrate-binding protein